MENRLRFLYALQLVDLELMNLEELKGDLPRTVRELQEALEKKKAERMNLEDVAAQSSLSRHSLDTDILSLKERLEKYKGQQFEVKTNKQYDALAREIDQSQDRIARLGKEMEILEGKMATAREDVEKMKPEIDELEKELADRKRELDSVSKEHEDEENKLRHEREKIAGRISKGDIQRYERIRNAKDGKAVVQVKRNSCGGCFNRVPPQKILELRKNAAIITCERCGRILVSDEIVEAAANPL